MSTGEIFGASQYPDSSTLPYATVSDRLAFDSENSGQQKVGSEPILQKSVIAGTSTSLAACGGGNGSSSTPPPIASPAPAPSPRPTASLQDASRLLAQATFGTSKNTIEIVSSQGIESWIDSQLRTSRTHTFWQWMEGKGYHQPENMYAQSLWQRPLWHDLMNAPDRLRMRVAMALMDIFTVGIGTLSVHWRSFSMAAYLDVLADHAFGNFRDLLDSITYSTAAGSFLTYIGSAKKNAAGRRPDENYARELMQLFTIGLYQLNPDGSRKAGSDGYAVPTYTQSDVSQLSRVFTGMTFDGDRTDHNRHQRRLIFDPSHNELGEVRFLQQSFSGGGQAAVASALDVLFNHSNSGPHIAYRLIQSLVTSNPSTDYVRRVSAVFDDNGRGVRGDLAAVVKAILLDAEARNPAATTGRLRDPIQRLLNWMWAFDVRDPADEWRMPPIAQMLGKAPGWSPTVFNFHQHDYIPANGSLSANNMRAPEFQLVSELTVVEYVNFMHRAIAGHFEAFGLSADTSSFEALSEDPLELTAELSLVLAADQMSDNSKSLISDSVRTITGSGQQKRRVQAATLLIMTSPDYLILK